jgi:tRNA-2-methylthio-N6-dimethylallyladenosine synthase
MRLVDLQRGISLKKNSEMIGRTVEVLVEGDAKKSSAQWMGRTDGNITVVWEKADPAVRAGRLIPIMISSASTTTLYGEASLV